MKSNNRIFTYLTISIFSLVVISFCYSQDAPQIAEPQIPVYFYANSADSTQSLSDNSKVLETRIDSLQSIVSTSSIQNSKHIAWMYILIAVLGIMNIVLFYVMVRIRKELGHVKRFEHQQSLTPIQASEEQIPPPPLQAPLEEIIEKPEPARKKTRARKSK